VFRIAVLVIAAFLVSRPAQAQTYSGCFDFRGIPVVTVMAPARRAGDSAKPVVLTGRLDPFAGPAASVQSGRLPAMKPGSPPERKRRSGTCRWCEAEREAR
jgi:hypothetical protein